MHQVNMTAFTFLYWLDFSKIFQKPIFEHTAIEHKTKKKEKGKSDPVTFEFLTGVGRWYLGESLSFHSTILLEV